MNNPKISVIVPIYNVEQYLDKCVESIVNQTYTNLEIVLVDDGSPDNCSAICDSWIEKDDRIRVIHKENGGLSDARNAGLTVATGDFVAFVDSDDFIECDMYEKLYEVINNTNADIAVCNLRYVYEDDSIFVTEKNIETITEYSTTEAMSALIDDKIRQVVWNKLYKADIIKNIPFDVGKYHEDEFWSYKAIGKASKVVTINYIGYNYLQRSDSIMGNNYSLKRLDAVEAKCCRQEFLNKNIPELVQQGLINLIFTCVYHGQQSLKFLNTTDKKIAMDQLCLITKSYKNLINVNLLSTKQKVWFFLTKLSLYLVCYIRNLIKIGD